MKRTLNESTPAPIDGLYRYELIPAETTLDYYIDLWFQYGIDEQLFINKNKDAVVLRKGDIVMVNKNGDVTVKSQQKFLKLVVNNE